MTLAAEPATGGLYDDYRRWMTAQGMSPRTIEERLKFLRLRLDDWGTMLLEPHEVAEWLGSYAGWTRRTYLGHLRSIYAHLVERGVIEVSPVERYRPPATPGPQPSPLADDQVDRALAAADADERAWLLLGLYAGLRCHEIAKFRGEHITSEGLRVLGKGGKDVVLPTHPLLWELAQSYPREGYWFPSPHLHERGGRPITNKAIGNRIAALFRSVGINTGSIHRTRHTYGTRLGRAGVAPRVIQKLMRHSSLDTTMRYLEASDAELSSAIGMLP